MEKEGLILIEDFLSDADFKALLRVIASSKKRIPYPIYGDFREGTEDEKKMASVINEVANKKIKELSGYTFKDALMRYENKYGLLHHDLNARNKRKYSLILYIEKPKAGGEIVFPFYDSDGKRTHNVVTETCEKLYDSEKYVSDDKSLQQYIFDNKDKLCTFEASPNTALVLNNHNRNLWHQVCPTVEGRRTAVALFWESDN